PMAIAFIDIDHFKRINDNWSHSTGDQALVLIAQQIRQHSRATDCAARWGGEEFVLLMPETSQEQARQVCERLRLAVMQMDCQALADGLCMTISIGVASAGLQPDSRSLLQQADSALYQAKQQGRNQVCYA